MLYASEKKNITSTKFSPIQTIKFLQIHIEDDSTAHTFPQTDIGDNKFILQKGMFHYHLAESLKEWIKSNLYSTEEQTEKAFTQNLDQIYSRQLKEKTTMSSMKNNIGPQQTTFHKKNKTQLDGNDHQTSTPPHRVFTKKLESSFSINHTNFANEKLPMETGVPSQDLTIITKGIPRQKSNRVYSSKFLSNGNNGRLPEIEENCMEKSYTPGISNQNSNRNYEFLPIDMDTNLNVSYCSYKESVSEMNIIQFDEGEDDFNVQDDIGDNESSPYKVKSSIGKIFFGKNTRKRVVPKSVFSQESSNYKTRQSSDHKSHRSSVTINTRFSHKFGCLFVSNNKGDLKQFDIETGEIIKHYKEAHSYPILCAVSTSDNNFIFTSDSQSIQKQWNPISQDLYRDHGKIDDDVIWCIYVTYNLKYLFTTDRFGKQRQFTFNMTAKIPLQKDYGKIHKGAIFSMTGTSDSKNLFTSDQNGTQKQYDILSGSIIQDYGEIHQGQIKCLAISNDDSYLFTSDTEGNLKQWAIADRILLKNFGKIHEGQILSMICCRQSKKLFTSDSSGNLKKWKIEGDSFEGSLEKDFGQAHQDEITSIDLAKNSPILFSCDRYGYLKEWDSDSGVLLRDHGKVLDGFIYKILATI